MADRASVRTRLRYLAQNNIVHRVVADKVNVGLVYLQDYTDNEFARFIIPHKDLLSIPKHGDGVMPIGLTQLDVAYECINTIEIFGIDEALLTRLRNENPEVLRRYQHGNVMKGITHEHQKELAGLDKIEL